MHGITLRLNGSSVELATLYEVSKVLSTSLDLLHTLRDVLRLLAYQMQMQRGRIYLQRDDGGLELVAAHAVAAATIADEGDHEREGLCRQILRTGMAEVAQPEGEPGLQRCGVPIKAAGRCLGVVTVDLLAEESAERSLGTILHFLTMIANLIGQTVRLYRSVVEERSFQQREQARLQRALPGGGRMPPVVPEVVYASPAMREVLEQVKRVAPFKSTVLLRGESGTGKELIAQAIHNLSARAGAPFVRVNCAALSETLLESELFGHERGAFTGANRERKGRFELASGGTLLLDEIGEISPAFQAKLLRVLQEQEFERVGGSQTLRSDVRLIAATNAPLEEAVGLGRFRADLYFRINVVSIFLPPLRERPEDISHLVCHFVSRFNRENGLELDIESDAVDALRRYPWPGNVRELQNCIERAATQCRDGVIHESDIAGQLDLHMSSAFLLNRNLGAPPATGVSSPGRCPVLPETCPQNPARGCSHVLSGRTTLRCPPSQPAAEPPATTTANEPDGEEPHSSRERLLWALEQTGWVQTKAARLLGLTTRQVRYALHKHNISAKRL